MALIRTYLIVGSASALARLTGFAQYVLFAAVVGAGGVAEAYVAAFLVPNIVRRTISEGALNAAFVPIHARRGAAGGAADATAFAADALRAIQRVSLGLGLLALLFMPVLVGVVAPGFASDPAKQADAVFFGRIGALYLALAPVTALYAAFLASAQRFAVPAFAALILNGALIVMSLGLLVAGTGDNRLAGLALALTTTLAGLAQFYVVRRAARWAGVAPPAGLPGRNRDVGLPGRNRDVGRMLLVAGPVMLLTGFSQVNILLAAQMSSHLPSAVAWVAYAERLFHLPLSFVSGAIGLVLLPAMVMALRGSDPGRAHLAFYRTLEFALLLSLPAAAALHLLAEPIVDVVYRRGAFQAGDVQGTADMLRWLALGLPGFVLATAFLPAFTAHERYRTPVLAALAALVGNVVVTQALASAAIGAAVAGWALTLMLGGSLAASRHLPPDALARRRLPAILAAALGTTLVVLALRALLGAWLDPQQAFPLRAAALGMLCLSGVGVHAGLALALKAVDPAEARAYFRRGA